MKSGEVWSQKIPAFSKEEEEEDVIVIKRGQIVHVTGRGGP
jgi:hypothetical protein